MKTMESAGQSSPRTPTDRAKPEAREREGCRGPQRRALLLWAIALGVLLMGSSARAQCYDWNNFAGKPLESAAWEPQGVAVDQSGNVYVAASLSSTVRMVTPSGVVTTLAGGSCGSADGTGNAASFNSPSGIAVDRRGNVYIADTGNQTIRKMTPRGVVTTLAGRPGVTGTANGKGREALFNNPRGLAVDKKGNVYVADSGNGTVRKVTPDGVVTNFWYYSSYGQPFANPNGVAVDGSGNIYVADTGNCEIVAMAPDGTIMDGFILATGTAPFSQPQGVAVDGSGNIYVADTGNNTIRKVTPDLVVRALAGTPGVSGSADGMGGAALFNGPQALAVDGSGNIYIADTGNSAIRKQTPDGVVTTLAANPQNYWGIDGEGSAARFFGPGGVAVDGRGNVYVADAGNNTIRKATPIGVVTTLAGSPGVTGSADGTGTAAQFCNPQGVAVDRSGNVYVADTWNCRIRKVSPGGVVTTLGGSTGPFGFYWPQGVAVDGSGNVYVADTGNSRIRKVTPDGVLTTLAGSGVSGDVDGTGTSAQFARPEGIAVDSSGNVYVADSGNNAIRTVTPGGVVATLSTYSPALANGMRSNNLLWNPHAIAVDGSGNSYLTVPEWNVIGKVTPDGVLTMIGGSGTAGDADGTGSAALFSSPSGVAVSSMGILYVADSGNDRISKGVFGTVAFTAGQSGVVASVLNTDAGFSGGNLTVAGVTQGTAGSVVINSDGTITYTPSATYTGSDSFAYTVTDGLGNTVITTCAVENGFMTAAGSYAGLITNGTASNDNSGAITVTLTGGGQFSGKLFLAGIGYPVKGCFDTNWSCQFSIALANQATLTAQLQLNPAKGQITGEVSTGTFTSAVAADRLSYDAKSAPAWEGEWTLSLPPNPLASGSSYPQGNGYLSLSVTAGGIVTAMGRLGDGTAISVGGLLVGGNSFPLYSGLYGKNYPTRGSIIGDVVMSYSFGGTLTWFKPTQNAGNYYRNGFSTTTDLSGWSYLPPEREGFLTEEFAITNGHGEVSLTGGNLTAPITRTINLPENFKAEFKVAVTKPAGDKVNLAISIKPTNGTFSGSFYDTDGIRRTFSGVIQDGGNGAIPNGCTGLFLGASEAGSINFWAQ